MFFGVWNKTRANKENIFYAIVTIFVLERVRTAWNRVESKGLKRGLARNDIDRTRDRLVRKAALLYALPLLLPVVKYIYRSIEELSWSVQGLVVLKNTKTREQQST
ncbi:MAG: hypothetical protein OEN01_09710 [Candidatus Krumholzibacteria bacterium]|nr:hypothetical protein [Candidatus Krumholzibacteria bacterium]